MKKKPILACDFDNTVAGYSKGWQGPGNIAEPPLPDCKSTLDLFSKYFEIIIFSCRASTEEGRNAIKQYMDKHKLPYKEITNIKPEGLILDDNALQFFSWKQAAKDVAKFKNRLDKNAKPNKSK